MKFTPEVGGRIKGVRTALRMTQERFARVLGVQQPTVSAWERGDPKYTPSADAFAALANLASNAGLHGDAVFLWRAAGVDIQAMSATLVKILKERGQVINVGQFVEIPRVRQSGRGFTDVGPAQPLPRFLVPSPGSTVLLDRTSHGGGLIVDTSITEINSLWGEVVLVDFSERDKGRGPLNVPDAHFVGVLTRKYSEDATGVWYLAELDCLTGWPYQYPVYVAAQHLPFSKSLKVPVQELSSRKRDALVRETLRGGLKTELTPLPGCRIVGRVFGWFWPPKKGKQEKSK